MSLTETTALQTISISPQELEKSLQKAKQQKISLLNLVLREKNVSEEALAQGMSEWLRLPRVRLASLTIDTDCARLISEELATRHVCLPLSVEGKTLVVAMARMDRASKKGEDRT